MGSVVRKPKPVPSYPEYRGNKFYEEINQFLRELVDIESHHYDTINRFTTLDQHYNSQVDLTTQYYD